MWNNIFGCSPFNEYHYVKVFLRAQYEQLGPMLFKEYMVTLYFLLLVVVWFFAEPSFMEGWSDWFQLPGGGGSVSEATPAILVLILILITPEKLNFWPFVDVEASSSSTNKILDWKSLSRVK